NTALIRRSFLAKKHLAGCILKKGHVLTGPFFNCLELISIVTQTVIRNHKCCHRFYNDDGSGYDTRVMTAFARNGGFVTRLIEGVLIAHYRSYRFEGNLESNVHAVRYSTLNPS